MREQSRECLVCPYDARRPRPHGYGVRYCSIRCRRLAEYERARLRRRARRIHAELAELLWLDRENNGLYSILRCTDGRTFQAEVADLRGGIAACVARIRVLLGGR